MDISLKSETVEMYLGRNVKPINYVLFILGLLLIAAGVYIAIVMKKVITGYREVAIAPSNLTQGYVREAVSAQTQPCTTIGITILIIGALLIVLLIVNRK